MLERVSNLLIPPLDDTTDTSDRAWFGRFAVLASCVIAFIQLACAPFVFFIFNQPVIAWILVAGGLTQILLLVWFRRTGTYVRAATLVIMQQTFFLLFMIYVYGGGDPVFLVWFPYLTMLAFFFLGRRSGVGFSIFLLAVLIALYGLELTGYQFPNVYQKGYSAATALSSTRISKR